MRLVALAGLCCLSLALVVGSGQGGGDKKEAKDAKAKGFLPQGWKALNLSAAQKEAIYKLQAEYKAKYDELKATEAKLKTQERADLVKVLSDEQKDALRKLVVGEDTKKK